MKKKTENMIPLVAAGVVPAAALTSALLAPLALGATGDLDPAFGDVGRLGPILNGPAWSLQSLEDDSILLGGGGLAFHYYYYSYREWYEVSNFVSLVSDAGSTDPNFSAPSISAAQVSEVARQPDGQIVAVGRTYETAVIENYATAVMHLTVLRMQADGQLDTTFANGGVFVLDSAEHGNQHMGASVVVDPDGRIVVAGTRDKQLIVLRLLPDGSFDDSFATSGIFAGPDVYEHYIQSAGARTSLLRTADGDYRVTALNVSGCQIIALTADGVIDEAFGTSGIATVDAPSGPSTSCNSLASQADGRLLVAGNAAGRAFAMRLLADGQPDPGFLADVVSEKWTDATSVAAADDGSIAVAGAGVSGAAIMRLQANGDLDVQFGNAGSTLIDLRSDSGTVTAVHDMVIRADGSVVAAGGEHAANQAFVVKLLGAGGGDSPGVLGVVEQAVIPTDEGMAEIIVNVGRTGGASGSVSLAYGTSPHDGNAATDGEDYEAVAGRLTWVDGDTAEQQIRVPILADDVAEHSESFLVTLGDVEGGAGLGTVNAAVEIAADGGPHGQLGFVDGAYNTEEYRNVAVTVMRDYYRSGAVSVTVTPIAGTATAGDDFDATPQTVSWADGQWGWKTVKIRIVDDALMEDSESFTLELSNPTGGAVLGPQSTATIGIAISDQFRPEPTRSARSGGAAIDYLSLLLLGIMTLLRRAGLAIRLWIPTSDSRWATRVPTTCVGRRPRL